MDYDILESDSANKLAMRVHEKMVIGVWKPIGGVCVTTIKEKPFTENLYTQAIIREPKED